MKNEINKNILKLKLKESMMMIHVPTIITHQSSRRSTGQVSSPVTDFTLHAFSLLDTY